MIFDGFWWFLQWFLDVFGGFYNGPWCFTMCFSCFNLAAHLSIDIDGRRLLRSSQLQRKTCSSWVFLMLSTSKKSTFKGWGLRWAEYLCFSEFGVKCFTCCRLFGGKCQGSSYRSASCNVFVFHVVFWSSFITSKSLCHAKMQYENLQTRVANFINHHKLSHWLFAGSKWAATGAHDHKINSETTNHHKAHITSINSKKKPFKNPLNHHFESSQCGNDIIFGFAWKVLLVRKLR